MGGGAEDAATASLALWRLGRTAGWREWTQRRGPRRATCRPPAAPAAGALRVAWPARRRLRPRSQGCSPILRSAAARAASSRDGPARSSHGCTPDVPTERATRTFSRRRGSASALALKWRATLASYRPRPSSAGWWPRAGDGRAGEGAPRVRDERRAGGAMALTTAKWSADPSQGMALIWSAIPSQSAVPSRALLPDWATRLLRSAVLNRSLLPDRATTCACWMRPTWSTVLARRWLLGGKVGAKDLWVWSGMRHGCRLRRGRCSGWI